MSPASIVLPRPTSSAIKQVDPRQLQRLAQRFELVGVEADAGPERRLKEARVGRRDAAPAHGAGVGGEEFRIVETLLADAAPAVVGDDPGVELVLPQHRNRLALRVVVDAGGAHKARVAKPRRSLDALDQPAALPQVDELPGLGQVGRCFQSAMLGMGKPTKNSMPIDAAANPRSALDARVWAEQGAEKLAFAV